MEKCEKEFVEKLDQTQKNRCASKKFTRSDKLTANECLHSQLIAHRTIDGGPKVKSMGKMQRNLLRAASAWNTVRLFMK